MRNVNFFIDNKIVPLMRNVNFFIDNKIVPLMRNVNFFTVIHMGPGTTMTNATLSARPPIFSFVDVFFSISTTTCCVFLSKFTTCYTSIIVNGSILYVIISSFLCN
jgi:hypothetical protein